MRVHSFIDPTLEQDLASRTKPWALSPLIATMPYFHHTPVAKSSAAAPAFPPKEPTDDDTSQLRVRATQTDGNIKGGKLKGNPSKRRSYFTNALRRQEVVFGPEVCRTSLPVASDVRRNARCSPVCAQDVITTDFCYDYLKFSPEGVTLRLPGGISIDMMKYWDGQPVRFVCCERLKKGERTAERPWGRVLWCVAIERAEEDSDGESVQEKEGVKQAQGSDVD